MKAPKCGSMIINVRLKWLRFSVYDLHKSSVQLPLQTTVRPDSQHLCTGIILLFTGARKDTFTSGSGPIFVRTLNCEEQSMDVFEDCVVENDLGLSDCSHNDDVGVHCEGASSIFALHVHILSFRHCQ